MCSTFFGIGLQSIITFNREWVKVVLEGNTYHLNECSMSTIPPHFLSFICFLETYSSKPYLTTLRQCNTLHSCQEYLGYYNSNTRTVSPFNSRHIRLSHTPILRPSSRSSRMKNNARFSGPHYFNPSSIKRNLGWCNVGMCVNRWLLKVYELE